VPKWLIALRSSKDLSNAHNADVHERTREVNGCPIHLFDFELVPAYISWVIPQKYSIKKFVF